MPAPCSFMSSLCDSIIAEINSKSTKVERKNILKIKLEAVKELSKLNIPAYPYIIGTFQYCGFNKVSLYYQIIYNYKEEFNHQFPWLNLGRIKRGNKSDINPIICLLLFTYGGKFISYLKDYLLENKYTEENIETLIQRLQKIMNDFQIKDIQNSTDSNELSSEYKENTNDQNDQKKENNDEENDEEENNDNDPIPILDVEFSEYHMLDLDYEDNYNEFFDTLSFL